MKLHQLFLKTLCSFLFLSLIFGKSLVTLAADEEHHFEKMIRSIKSRDISCFISHAWEGNNPNPLVAQLEQHLDLSGIVTYYDARPDERGANGSIPRFMGNIEKVDYILMVFTPTFKEKYKKGTDVATEVDYVITNILNKQPKKLIPILFSGIKETSIPALLTSVKYYDFTNPDTYYHRFFDVLRHVLPSRTVELNRLKDFWFSQICLGLVPSRIESPMNTPIPDIARGYEDIYRRFIGGKLIYKPNKDNDVGRIEIPFLSLPNPLENAFDLSRCGDTGGYLSIATGYRKGQKAENANKVEVWIVPKFVVEKNQASSAEHLAPIMENITSSIGLFWTWGDWDDTGRFDYLITQDFNVLSNGENLYEKWAHGSMSAMKQAPTKWATVTAVMAYHIQF